MDAPGHTTTGTTWNTQPCYFSNPDCFGNLRWPASIVTPPYDFDGDEATFSPAELAAIGVIHRGVAADWTAFNVDVTTEAPDFSLAGGRGQRVLIGGRDSDWYVRSATKPTAGGVAFMNTFGKGSCVSGPCSADGNEVAPAFVFTRALGETRLKVRPLARSGAGNRPGGRAQRGRRKRPAKWLWQTAPVARALPRRRKFGRPSPTRRAIRWAWRKRSRRAARSGLSLTWELAAAALCFPFVAPSPALGSRHSALPHLARPCHPPGLLTAAGTTAFNPRHQPARRNITTVPATMRPSWALPTIRTHRTGAWASECTRWQWPGSGRGRRAAPPPTPAGPRAACGALAPSPATVPASPLR